MALAPRDAHSAMYIIIQRGACPCREGSPSGIGARGGGMASTMWHHRAPLVDVAKIIASSHRLSRASAGADVKR